MSTRGINFANEWAQENIQLEPYLEPGSPMIGETVARLVADARAAGISAEEIEEDMGDLHDFVAEQFENRTDNEVERLASKDD